MSLLHRIKVFLVGEKNPNYLEEVKRSIEQDLKMTPSHPEREKLISELKAIAEVEKLRYEAKPKIEKKPFVSGDTIVKCTFAAGMAFVGYHLEKEDGLILGRQFDIGRGLASFFKF